MDVGHLGSANATESYLFMPKPTTDDGERRALSPTLNGKSPFTRRSDRLLAGLADFKTVTLVSHVHPDPDSLGSMVGLAYLISSCLNKPRR